MEYVDTLYSHEILIDGQKANKILDVRIPSGTKSLIDIELLQSVAEERDITLIIKVF